MNNSNEVKRTQGEWFAKGGAIIKNTTPLNNLDNGEITIAQCYTTIEGSSFEFKHLHPEIEEIFEKNPLLKERVITTQSSKANAEFICKAVNEYDKLKEDNEALKKQNDILKTCYDAYEKGTTKLKEDNAALLDALRNVKQWIDGEDNEFQETVIETLKKIDV